MAATGTWQLSIRTPVGSLAVELVVTGNPDARAGVARGQGQNIDIPYIAVTTEADGQRLMWTQKVTKPLRLSLDFDVLVLGDTMSGTARAGRLPASQVRGTRQAATT